MARPVSWLPRLPAIARSVSESVRSHYTSRDLERLFEVQPRSAQMLLEVLPTIRVGKSQLVEREALAGFLSRLVDAEDPQAELRRIRAAGRPPAVRRKLRDLVPRDTDAGPAGLPANVSAEPGSLLIRFATVEELAAALWRLSAVLEEDLEGFAERYEPREETSPAESSEDAREREDVRWIREWMEGGN